MEFVASAKIEYQYLKNLWMFGPLLDMMRIQKQHYKGGTSHV
jgi:hypothetical protein